MADTWFISQFSDGQKKRTSGQSVFLVPLTLLALKQHNIYARFEIPKTITIAFLNNFFCNSVYLRFEADVNCTMQLAP